MCARHSVELSLDLKSSSILPIQFHVGYRSYYVVIAVAVDYLLIWLVIMYSKCRIIKKNVMLHAALFVLFTFAAFALWMNRNTSR